jgi:DNA-directed RNA polymerase specialized sigma subunit
MFCTQERYLKELAPSNLSKFPQTQRALIGLKKLSVHAQNFLQSTHLCGSEFEYLWLALKQRLVDPSSLEYMNAPLSLADALAQLPEEERIILTLHYLRSMPSDEIAKLLGAPEKSVIAVMASGKGRITALLGLG